MKLTKYINHDNIDSKLETFKIKPSSFYGTVDIGKITSLDPEDATDLIYKQIFSMYSREDSE